jgi:hypothetical protein
MNRLARGSGLAVSALTAATATILLLLPGRVQLEYPAATVGASGGAIVTSGATAPSGNGRRGPASASEHGQGLTVSGTGTVLWSTTVTATSYPGFAGAALRARAPVGDCSGVPGTTKNDYVISCDTVSGRWSREIPLDSGCASR